MAAVLGAIEVSRFWVAEPQGAGSAGEPPNAATGNAAPPRRQQPGKLTLTPPSLDQWLVERGLAEQRDGELVATDLGRELGAATFD